MAHELSGFQHGETGAFRDGAARNLHDVQVTHVLSVYGRERGPMQSNQAKLKERLRRLSTFWADRTLADVNGANCREYVEIRGSRGGARRDLEDLRSAINYHAREGLHHGVVRVPLPPAGMPRDRWLSRSEVARLLWVCWRTREVQTVHRGQAKGERVSTNRYPLRHLARFILIGVYTGTRAGAIMTASPSCRPGRSFVDLESGIFYRLAQGLAGTKKRQPPIPVPPRLLAHMRRWQEKGIVQQYFVEWNGRPVKSVKTGFSTAVRLAGLEGSVSPHTLRHTAATWLMQAGAPKWEAAGFLGMTESLVDRVYGHHHPNHLRIAAQLIGYRPLR